MIIIIKEYIILTLIKRTLHCYFNIHFKLRRIQNKQKNYQRKRPAIHNEKESIQQDNITIFIVSKPNNRVHNTWGKTLSTTERDKIIIGDVNTFLSVIKRSSSKSVDTVNMPSQNPIYLFDIYTTL